MSRCWKTTAAAMARSSAGRFGGCFGRTIRFDTPVLFGVTKQYGLARMASNPPGRSESGSNAMDYQACVVQSLRAFRRRIPGPCDIVHAYFLAAWPFWL